MKGVRKYLLPAAVWFFVAVYVVWAVRLADKGFSAAKIDRVEVEITDSSADRRLVTGQMVRNWINRSGIEVAGQPVDRVDLQGIERVVADNGFVGSVSAYAAADGVLRVDVSQRTPLFRLLTDGYDRYVTSDGFVFGTPSSSAIYVPVITGSWRPQFPSGYEGSTADYCESLISGENGILRKIAELREQRTKVLAANTLLDKDIEKLKKEKPKKRKIDGEDKRKYKEHVAAEKDREIAAKESEKRRNTAEVARLSREINSARADIKKTREKYEDFLKLLNFVERLEDDDFWRSEIVQIVAVRSSRGAAELRLVPRSGGFVIDFGEIAEVDAKFDKLARFYRKGLRNLGWDNYSVVSVAYKGQVVCKKK